MHQADPQDLERLIIGANASMFRATDPAKIDRVFHPSNTEELREAIQYANNKNLAITPKGGGTSLSGACTGGSQSRIVITSHNLQRIIEFNPKNNSVRVEPGITPRRLNQLLREKGYRFYVTPSSDDAATLGGMISTDAGGADAWLNGTMYDNTIEAKILDEKNNLITVDKEGFTCDDPSIESQLTHEGFNLFDLAQSHGTLGFIAELTVKIRPIEKTATSYGCLHFENLTDFADTLCSIIDNQIPLLYSETIAQRHLQLAQYIQTPVLIIQYPSDLKHQLKGIGDLKDISQDEFLRLKKLRADLPKTNPQVGVQKAYFEGYGYTRSNLSHFEELNTEVNSIWEKHEFQVFLRYGHAPCKWYTEDRKPKYGMILHGRETTTSTTPKEVHHVLKEILEFCQLNDITPKPEHKWPYRNTSRKKRLQKLATIIGKQFNPFILTADLDDLKPLTY